MNGYLRVVAVACCGALLASCSSQTSSEALDGALQAPQSSETIVEFVETQRAAGGGFRRGMHDWPDVPDLTLGGAERRLRLLRDQGAIAGTLPDEAVLQAEEDKPMFTEMPLLLVQEVDIYAAGKPLDWGLRDERCTAAEAELRDGEQDHPVAIGAFLRQCVDVAPDAATNTAWREAAESSLRDPKEPDTFVEETVRYVEGARIGVDHPQPQQQPDCTDVFDAWAVYAAAAEERQGFGVTPDDTCRQTILHIIEDGDAGGAVYLYYALWAAELGGLDVPPEYFDDLQATIDELGDVAGVPAAHVEIVDDVAATYVGLKLLGDPSEDPAIRFMTQVAQHTEGPVEDRLLACAALARSRPDRNQPEPCERVGADFSKDEDRMWDSGLLLVQALHDLDLPLTIETVGELPSPLSLEAWHALTFGNLTGTELDPVWASQVKDSFQERVASGEFQPSGIYGDETLYLWPSSDEWDEPTRAFFNDSYAFSEACDEAPGLPLHRPEDPACSFVNAGFTQRAEAFFEPSTHTGDAVTGHATTSEENS